MATLPVLPNGHFGLQNDMVYYFPLQDEDVNNNIVPAPTGDVVTAAATGPHASALSFSVGSMPVGAPVQGPAVIATPMVMVSDASNGGGGIGLTLTDTSNLAENSTTSAALFDITVPPPGPATQEGVDFPGVFMATQPTPPNPGP
jgi:hypothetical protein